MFDKSLIFYFLCWGFSCFFVILLLKYIYIYFAKSFACLQWISVNKFWTDFLYIFVVVFNMWDYPTFSSKRLSSTLTRWSCKKKTTIKGKSRNPLFYFYSLHSLDIVVTRRVTLPLWIFFLANSPNKTTCHIQNASIICLKTHAITTTRRINCFLPLRQENISVQQIKRH